MRSASGWKLFALMLVGVVLGVPIVAYVWETIHELLTLRPDPGHIAVSVPLLAILVVLLRRLGRAMANGS